jgi:hypothetical protein
LKTADDRTRSALNTNAKGIFSTVFTKPHTLSAELCERKREGWDDFHGFTKLITTTRVIAFEIRKFLVVMIGVVKP